MHPFNESSTKELANQVNQRSNATQTLKSILLVDSNFERDAYFDSGIQDQTWVSRVDPIYGDHLKNRILKAKKNMYGFFRQKFETECRSYNTMTYLLSAFLFVQLIFTLPYIVYSSKRQRFIENQYSIPALQAEFRTKFNMWIFLILTFMILQTVGQIILDSQCPLYAYEFQSAGARVKTWFAFLLIPLSQALIDYGLVYLASLSLSTMLPYHNNKWTLYSIFILSFLTTAVALIFKVVDTHYDMLIALLFPLIKFYPFFVSITDSWNTSMQFRSHLLHERADQTNQGKLITLYRLHVTFR